MVRLSLLAAFYHVSVMGHLYLQHETNSPGLVVAVSVDGKQVWSKGQLHAM
jgi:hypothetical protein